MNLLSSLQYSSRRSPVLSSSGVVATSQPLASLAGIEVLAEGGSAADAAVAAAAALQVTQPCSTGLGGDCFVLYFNGADGSVSALNGSGRSPSALTPELARKQGFVDRFPAHHAYTVTVPGASVAWVDLHDRWGALPLSRVLVPAIELAEKGFPVAPLTALWWQSGAERLLWRCIIPNGSSRSAPNTAVSGSGSVRPIVRGWRSCWPWASSAASPWKIFRRHSPGGFT